MALGLKVVSAMGHNRVWFQFWKNICNALGDVFCFTVRRHFLVDFVYSRRIGESSGAFHVYLMIDNACMIGLGRVN